MKCIKNAKTGNIIRVDDYQANQMVGSTWSYVSKSEWKKIVRPQEPVAETVTEETTISEKQLKHKKNVKNRS